MTPTDLIVAPTGLRFLGRHFPCTWGKGGITGDKREGDGATPRGNHRIVGMLYRPDRMARPTSWAEPILPGDLWSDASGDAQYNQWVRAPYTHSHQSLPPAAPLFDLVFLNYWNWPAPTPGKGSAIFIHRWRRPGYPTEGCVALRPDHLLWIAQRLAPTSRLIVP